MSAKKSEPEFEGAGCRTAVEGEAQGISCISRHRAAALALVGLGSILPLMARVLRLQIAQAAQISATRVRGTPLTQEGILAVHALVERLALVTAVIFLLIALSFWSGERSATAVRVRRSARRVWVFMPTTVVHLVFSLIVIIAPGYRFMPNPNNDLGTYFAIALSAFDVTFAPGDMRSRSVEARGLPGYVLVFRVLSAGVGFDLAAFLLALLAVFILSISLFQIGRSVGLNQSKAVLVSALGLGLTWGTVSYPVAIISDYLAFPTPRILAIAFVVAVIALVLVDRLLLASLVGIAASSIHALDGFIPSLLAIAAGFVMKMIAFGSDQTRVRARWAGLVPPVGVAAVGVSVVVLFVQSANPEIMVSNDVALVFAWMGLVAIVIGAGIRRRTVSSLNARDVLGGLLCLILGLGFVMGRGLGPSGASQLGIIERIRLFESVLTELRNPGMADIAAQSSFSVALIVLLTIVAIVPLLGSSGPLAMVLPSHSARAHSADSLAVLSLVAFTAVALGSLLQNRTSLLGIASIWPARYAWLVVPGALVSLVRLLPSRNLPGLFPTATALLILFRIPTLREPISLLILFSGMALLVFQFAALRRASGPLQETDVARPSSDVPPQQAERLRDGWPVAALGLTILLLVPIVRDVPTPLIRLEASRDRLAVSRPEVQLARIAASTVETDARILLPLTGSWGSFRVLSFRGVAFDWKHFSSDTASWYEEFRRMCDPDYRFAPQSHYGQPSRQSVADCYRNHGPEELARVAAAFAATHAIVQRGQWPEAEIVGQSDDGDLVLVVVPSA